MKNQDKPLTLAEEAIEETAMVGCLQFFPIFFLLLMALVVFILSFAEPMVEDGQGLIDGYEEWIVNSFIIISLIGLLIGIVSSLFFFSAGNKKNIKTMKKGIMLNITAWIIYTICLLVSVTFILDL